MTEANTNGHDHEADDERTDDGGDSLVLAVTHCADCQQQQGRANNLSQTDRV